LGLPAPLFENFPTDLTFLFFVLVGIFWGGGVCCHDVFY
jgi:hypothetical protein